MAFFFPFSIVTIICAANLRRSRSPNEGMCRAEDARLCLLQGRGRPAAVVVVDDCGTHATGVARRCSLTVVVGFSRLRYFRLRSRPSGPGLLTAVSL